MPCRPFLGHHQPAVARCVLTGQSSPRGRRTSGRRAQGLWGAETPKRAELATMLRTSLIVATLASVSSPRPPATVFTVRSWGPSAAVRLRENPRNALLALV